MKVAHSKASSGLVQLSTAFESYVKVAHSKAVKMEDIVIPSLRAM